MCYLSAEFFTGHSQGKHQKFSPTNFPSNRNCWHLDFTEVMLAEHRRFCLLMVCMMSEWPEVFLSSKSQCSGNGIGSLNKRNFHFGDTRARWIRQKKSIYFHCCSGITKMFTDFYKLSCSLSFLFLWTCTANESNSKETHWPRFSNQLGLKRPTALPLAC